MSKKAARRYSQLAAEVLTPIVALFALAAVRHNPDLLLAYIIAGTLTGVGYAKLFPYTSAENPLGLVVASVCWPVPLVVLGAAYWRRR